MGRSQKTLTLGLRCTLFFRLAIERISADCKLGMMGGTTMSAFEVILSLVIVWTPGRRDMHNCQLIARLA
jgi:hypothetical protein